ncbi:class F sortase [Streptomyces thermocarboxydus]
MLVGHLDSETGDLGEFAALRDVRAGDTVEVRRDGAEPVVYRVTARTTVPKDELPPSAFRRTGPPVLTLITCAPPFEPERGGYTANLVLTAEPWMPYRPLRRLTHLIVCRCPFVRRQFEQGAGKRVFPGASIRSSRVIHENPVFRHALPA